MNFISLNGIQIPAQQPVLHSTNRGFMYGDGLFETIRMVNGEMPLSQWHFKRLFHGMVLTKITKGAITEGNISSSIKDLCAINKCMDAGRVRLQVFRGRDGEANFLIEALPLQPGNFGWLEKGFSIDVFPAAKKAVDVFSNLKSCNFLPYIMAGLYAQENIMDDAIVLNSYGRICDTSRANIFLVKDNYIYTPSAEEGCVEGVMRAYLIEKLKGRVIQTSLTQEDLLEAQEVFLSNAIFGIRWVRNFRDKFYGYENSKRIYSEIVSTIFH